VTEEFVDTGDACYGKLAQGFKFSLEQFHVGCVLGNAARRLKQDGRLIFHPLTPVERVPVVP
jgi:hypothetical protein